MLEKPPAPGEVAVGLPPAEEAAAGAADALDARLADDALPALLIDVRDASALLVALLA